MQLVSSSSRGLRHDVLFLLEWKEKKERKKGMRSWLGSARLRNVGFCFSFHNSNSRGQRVQRKKKEERSSCRRYLAIVVSFSSSSAWREACPGESIGSGVLRATETSPNQNNCEAYGSVGGTTILSPVTWRCCEWPDALTAPSEPAVQQWLLASSNGEAELCS